MNIISQHLNHLIGQRESHLWNGYVNMLKTLESVFLSPKHWILEFLQNAEDAGAEKFSIRLEQDSLVILNDGKEFRDEDFYAICDVNSRKLPSKGFRGYIGIGFKSIFRITDCISIHSGKFHFEFDKKHWQTRSREERLPISKWPWEILPIPIEVSKAELPEGYRTGFYVSLSSKKGQEALQQISDFLTREFPKEIILLLKNVEVIEIKAAQNSFNIKKEILEPSPNREQEFVIAKKESSESGRTEETYYLVLRKVVQVPEEIRQDEETERVRRSEISEREIGLMFGLDSGKNLQALSGKLTGVYSFLPVEGEQTELPFGIFGDLIPQPGRDLINYRAEWNYWMCNEVAAFFGQVVREVFLNHPLWRFFPATLADYVLSYTCISGPGKEFWDTRLRNPIKQFLETEALYPDEEGEFQRLEDLCIVSDEVIKVIGKDKLKAVIHKKIAHPSIVQQMRQKIEVIDLDSLSEKGELFEFIKGQPEKFAEIPINSIYNLLYRREFLEPLKDQPKRLATVYQRIKCLDPYYINGRRGRDTSPLYEVPFVLADDGEFYPPNQMVALEISVDLLPLVFKTFPSLEEKKRLHPEIAQDKETINALKQCHLEVINNKHTIIENMGPLSRKILTSSEKHHSDFIKGYPDNFINATLSLIAKGEYQIDRLVAQDGTLQEPKNLFVPRSPQAPLDWDLLYKSGLLPGFQPIHEKYLDKRLLEENGLQADKVYQCLQKSGVHGFEPEKDKSLIESAAYAIAKKELSEKGHMVADVTRRDKLGYDFECQGHCRKVFEVKGMGKA
ncbi:MAG: hypothetical protein AB1798_18575, partial [Spirochaetota bacterium]